MLVITVSCVDSVTKRPLLDRIEAEDITSCVDYLEKLVEMNPDCVRSVVLNGGRDVTSTFMRLAARRLGKEV